jgi:hypothetical protein
MSQSSFLCFPVSNSVDGFIWFVGILETAYTSFMAARVDAYISSEFIKENGELFVFENKPNVVIHTGNWGTGEFLLFHLCQCCTVLELTGTSLQP